MSKLVLTVVFAATTTVVGLVIEINIDSVVSPDQPRSAIARMLERFVPRDSGIDNPTSSTLRYGGKCHA